MWVAWGEYRGLLEGEEKKAFTFDAQFNPVALRLSLHRATGFDFLFRRFEI